MTISHVHCRVKDLSGAVAWFTSRCVLAPSFSDARMAVLQFGDFTLILDAASEDSVATIGFNSDDCDADFAALVARGARALEPPRDRPYGARVAYLQGPGALTIEIEQLLQSA
ncbi:MAG TPA: VOC family protein [Vicinamibacterales bacterium]|nr:VOC family protein [Vicinamibacterales bacterium]